MKPSEAFAARRSVFDEELAGLIDSAASASNQPLATTTGEPALRSRPIVGAKQLQPTDTSSTSSMDRLDSGDSTQNGDTATTASSSPISRSGEHSESTGGDSIKTEPGTEDGASDNLYVHPARRAILGRGGKSHERTPTSSGFGGSLSSFTTGYSRHEKVSCPFTSQPRDRMTASPSSNATSSPLQNKTWVTKVNAVKRQWDIRKDDLTYAQLLELRRNEKVDNIDRYVPELGKPRPAKRTKHTINLPRRRTSQFPFEKLPEQAQKRVFDFLLVSDEPIKIDFTWLRSFIRGHARVPVPYKTINHEGANYEIPVTANEVVEAVAVMQQDMETFKVALEQRAYKSRKTRAPCLGLTTSLLRVSRSMHKQAARTLYGQNVFSFPWASTAWMQLESFLATIGPTNISYIRNLRIHVPQWHEGIQHDFIEGAILDLTSPVSRLAVIKPPAHDRLLSAIEHCVSDLLQAGELTSLELMLDNGVRADYWSGRYHDDGRLISTAEAEEHTLRKSKGIEVLKQLSTAMSEKPMLILGHWSRWSGGDGFGCKNRLAAMVAEATKYGWQAG